MPEGWKAVRLSDVVGLRRGHDLPTRDRRPGRVPVVGSGGPSGFHNQEIALGPGVVLGRATNLGKPYWVGSGPYWPLNTSLYVTDFKGNDPRFVFHLFQVLDLTRFNSGSVQPMLNRNYIAGVPVNLPPLNVQRGIAGVLGALEDLIDTNQRLIRSCRQLASTVYSCAEIAETIAFGSVATLVRDTVQPEAIAEGTPYLGLEHFAENGEGIQSWGSGADSTSAKSMFLAGDVLYGKLRPYFRKVDRPARSGVCSTEAWVLRPKPGFSPEYLYALAQSQAFTEWAMSGSTGTRMPRANWEHVQQFQVQLPPKGAMSQADQAARTLWEAVWQLQSEQAAARRTRDELLPLLLSGRVLPGEVGR